MRFWAVALLATLFIAPHASAEEMQVVSGTYVGNGVASRPILGLGFQPTMVMVKSAVLDPLAMRTSTMTGDATKILTSTGLSSGMIRSLDADGFTVGSNNSVNRNGTTYYWTAFKSAASRVAVGAYTGNEVSGRVISTGFRPEYVIVACGSNGTSAQRFAAQTGDASLGFDGGGELTNRITVLDSTSFRLGTDRSVNRSNFNYHWIAFSGTPGRMGAGAYTGDAIDDRNLTTPFAPSVLFLSRRQSGAATQYRPPATSGDRTLPFIADSGYVNGVQSLLADGFQVGTNLRVNASGSQYFWFGAQDGSGFDLALAQSASATSANEGDTVSFTFTLSNSGPATASAVTMSATLDPNLVFLDAVPSQGTLDPGMVWQVGDLAGEAVATLRVDARVATGTAGNLLGSTGVASAAGDLYAPNNTAAVSVLVPVTDFAIDIVAEDATPTESGPANFIVTVTNLGPNGAVGVEVRDSLAVAFTRLSATPSQGSYNPSTGHWLVGNLALGASATLTLRTRVSPGTAHSIPVSAATLAKPLSDPVALNNYDSVSVRVVPNRLRVLTGTYVGNGTASRAITGLGFQPDVVLIKATTARAAVVRTREMSGNSTKDLGGSAANGPDMITGLNSDGFNLGSSVAVNENGTTYHWTALLEAPGTLVVGSYMGNGADDRALAGLEIAPVYAMVLAEGARPAVQRFGTQSGDATLSFTSGPELTDRIQSLDSDGFELGASADVNTTGVRYHYVAWGTAATLAGGATYSGDGADDRSLAVPGFRPDLVLLARASAVPVFRTRSISGDLTLPTAAAAGISNSIQSLRALGFQAGSDATANETGQTYHLAGLRDVFGADVGVSLTADTSTPNIGDTIIYTARATNHGPEPATGVTIEYLLPSGLSWIDATPSQGVFDTTSGVWSAGALNNGSSATLTMRTRVNPGTAGMSILAVARRTGSAPADLFADDDADSVSITVQLADLAVSTIIDDVTPTEGEVVLYSVRVDNLGPNAAGSIVVSVPLPAGITFSSASATDGSYSPGTGIWTIGAVASGANAILALRGTIDAGTAGATPVLHAQITQSDQFDPVAANDSDSIATSVLKPFTRVVTGTYTGNGAAAHAITGVGFQPDLVLIKSTLAATGAVLRTKSMPGDAAKDLGGTLALAASRIRSIEADGFTLGSDPAVNQAGVTYHWTAILEAPGQVLTGSYVGDGADDRSLTGFGFTPGYLLIASAGARGAYHRFAAETGDASLPLSAAAEAANRIQRLDADGFQMGNAAEVNETGVVHHYVAFSTAVPIVTHGSFTGNGADNRDVTAPGFHPELMILQRPLGRPVHRSSSAMGDLTLPLTAAPGFTNGIQSFLSDGFQVGSDAAVNASGVTSYYAVLRNGLGADLGVTVAASDSLPGEGETVTFDIRVSNYGPHAAASVTAIDSLPAGLTYLDSTPSQGAYSPVTGTWTLGSLASGASATLAIVARVDAGTGGTSMTNRARIATSDTVDFNRENDDASALVRIRIVDLQVRYFVDDASPTENELVTLTMRVTNLGPIVSGGIVASAPLPPGISLQSSTPSQGTYAASTGLWTIGTLDSGAVATLDLRVTPDPGTGGTTAIAIARREASDHADPVASNDADTVAIRIQRTNFRVLSGSYVGNGASSRALTGIGFQPDLLIIRGAQATPTMVRAKSMTGDASKDLAGATSLVAGRIRSLDEDGFTVGGDASVNTNGVTYYWTAFLETAGQMKIGSYVGTGADNRNVTGLGFNPGYVMVIPSGTQLACQRFQPEVGDASFVFGSDREDDDRIQGFVANGFQAGTSINTPGTTFHYAAWSPSTRMKTGLYLGNGVDDRAIVDVGFRPAYTIVKRQDTGAAAQRMGSVAGDLTLPGSAITPYANGIQSLIVDGFQLGTGTDVNSAGRVYFWSSFRDVASIDLGLRVAADDSTVNDGQSVTFDVRIVNHGPENATGVAVTNLLPAGITYDTHIVSRGVFDPGTGVWQLGSLPNGDSASVQIQGTVDSGTRGQVLTDQATLSALDQTDSNSGNDLANASVRVLAADLAVTSSADLPTRSEGDPVTLTIRVDNSGPDPASNVVMNQDVVPAGGLTWTGATPSQGTFTLATGVWQAGTIAPGDSATVVLQGTVAGGTGGNELIHIASADADEADPTTPDNSDTTSIFVASGPGISFAATHPIAVARPLQSGVELMQITVLNSSTEDRTLERMTLTNRTRGPGTETQRDAELGSVRVRVETAGATPQDTLPPATASGGVVTFDAMSVLVPSGSFVRLHVESTLPSTARDGDSLDVALEGAGAASFDQPVSYLNPWPVSPPGAVAVDGMVAGQLSTATTPLTDPELGRNRTLALAVLIPSNGYEADVLEALRVFNLGSAVDGVDIEKVELWSDGGDQEFNGGSGDDALLGNAIWDGSRWTRTGLTMAIPAGGRRLFVTIDAADSATVGRTVRISIPVQGITMSSGNDGPIDTTFANPMQSTIRTGPSPMSVFVHAQNVRALLPGAGGTEVYRFSVLNRGSVPETLTTIALTNRTLGPGTQVQLDADWLPLRMLDGTTELGTSSLSAGRAVFSGLSRVLAPGDTLTLAVVSGASLLARDGDLLDLSLQSAGDLGFTSTVSLVGAFPLSPIGDFPVDGMALAQMSLDHPTAPSVLTGSNRNLALDVRVPANGYEPDTLQFLVVRNNGNATPVSDIRQVEAWADDGDATFEPALGGDTLLGTMLNTGGTWLLGGLGVAIPEAGRHVFVSCDIPQDATEGRTVRLALPSSPIAGLSMASANDGPRDADGVNPTTITISTTDRVIVGTQSIPGGTVAPGDTQVVLLQIVARNTYADSARTLTGLTLTNLTRGTPGTPQAKLDGEVHRLRLRADHAGGPVLATGFFSLGRAVFSGFGWSIAPGEVREVFVTADVSPFAAADGDVIETAVIDETSLEFGDATSVSARFPLSSSAVWTVNGMRARQILNFGAPTTTLGRSEGPVLAMDWLVPANGYRGDVLERVSLVNTGSALPSEIAEIHLWRDGGDGLAGSVDDVDLGTLSWLGNRWSSAALQDSIHENGVRLFATAATSDALQDSSSLRLQIPIDGLQVRSGNDGPTDVPVTNSAAILLSTSRLLATFALESRVSVAGDTLAATMTVRNTGQLAVTGIVPSALVMAGDGLLTPLAGHTPASLDLAPGTQGTFVWEFGADAAGIVTLTGSASGTELGTGEAARSLEITTDSHQIFAQAASLEVLASESMPFSVNRGQTQVVPFSLTFTNPGGENVSAVLVRRLTVRLEDEAGTGIVPSTLLSRVTLNEGANEFVELTALPSTGSTMDLVLARPVRVEGGGASGGQITVSLGLDISDTTRVLNFRAVVDGASSFAAEDATNGAPVSVVTHPSQTYPIRSEVTRVVARATELDIAGVADTARAVGRGQTGVRLVQLSLVNPGPVGLGPDVRLSAFAVSLIDAQGAIVNTPSSILTRIRVSTATSTLLDRPIESGDDSLVTLALSPFLSLPINTPTVMTISGEIAESAVLGTFHLRLADTSHAVARNASNGARLPVITTPSVIEGAPITILSRADSLRAKAVPELPATLSVGSVDVTAMTLTLRHPGSGLAGAIRCEQLLVRCRDQANVALVPATFVDRAHVMLGGVEVGAITTLPSSGGEFSIPLNGVTIAPGAEIALELRFDVKTTAPTVFFSLGLGPEGIVAKDVNLGTPVAVGADVGAEFPLSSGLTHLEAPPRQLVASFEASLPAVLAADGSAISAGRLVLRNPASNGDIRVDQLQLVAGDAQFAAVPLGRSVIRAEAWVNGALWAETSDLALDASAGSMVAGTPVTIAPGAPVTIDLRIRLRPEASPEAFRVGLRSEGIGVIQPSSPLLSVSVVAEEGKSFPFWTDIGSSTGLTLPTSYSNFPNPFAAGRDQSRFVFYLKSSARVTLKLWTARGDLVSTLLDGDAFPAGLHQGTVWDGRNDRGVVVMNGAYLAQIEVAYDDGTREQVMRKIAVVR